MLPKPLPERVNTKPIIFEFSIRIAISFLEDSLRILKLPELMTDRIEVKNYNKKDTLIGVF